MSENTTTVLKAPDYADPTIWSLSCAYLCHISSRTDKVISDHLIELGVDPKLIVAAEIPTYAEAFQLSAARA